MPDRVITDSNLRDLFAIVLVMMAGLIARTLVNSDPFNVKKFFGELILAAMFGAAIYAFGIVQGLGFWQTMIISLLSGMGTTRSLEWLIKATSATGKGQ